MDVFVKWKESGKITMYEFDNASSKYAYQKYRESIEKKGGIILDALDRDFDEVQEFKKSNNGK